MWGLFKSSQQLDHVDNIIPILQVRKLRLREIKGLQFILRPDPPPSASSNMGEGLGNMHGYMFISVCQPLF